MNLDSIYEELKDNARIVERQFLQSIFFGPGSKKTVQLLEPEYFINPDFSKLFCLLKECSIYQKSLTAEIVQPKYSKEKQTYLELTSDKVTEYIYPKSLADLIIKNHEDRTFLALIYDKYLGKIDTDTVLNSIANLRSDLHRPEENMTTLAEQTREMREQGKIAGTPTSIEGLDKMTNGIRQGHLIVIGGYTSTGKTQFTLNVAKALADNKKRVLFFSLEMTSVDIFQRLVSIGANKNIINYLRKFGEPTEFEQVIDELEKSTIQIVSKDRTLDQIIASAQRERQTKGVDAVIIDYAQMINTRDISEYDRMTRISQTLQDFAKTNEVAVILISQVSNEHAKLQNDKMIGFKGGGSLPASADIAIELYSPQSTEEIEDKKKAGLPIDVTVHVKKNRHGQTGKVHTLFHTSTGVFKENDSYVEMEKITKKLF